MRFRAGHWLIAALLAGGAHAALLGWSGLAGPAGQDSRLEDFAGSGAQSRVTLSLDGLAPQASRPALPTAAQQTTQTPAKPVGATRQLAVRRPDTPPEAARRAAPRARAAPQTGGSGRRDLEADYFGDLQRWLASHRTVAESQLRNGVTGTVELEFEVLRDGRVRWYRVHRSSGNSDLDAAAKALIVRANPLPPFPDALHDRRLQLTIPVSFNVD